MGSLGRGAAAAGRVVARRRHAIVSWAALSAVSSRAVYCGVAEVSIYVAATPRAGHRRTLLTALIDRSETAGLWTAAGGHLPRKRGPAWPCVSCGFRVVGRRWHRPTTAHGAFAAAGAPQRSWAFPDQMWRRFLSRHGVSMGKSRFKEAGPRPAPEHGRCQIPRRWAARTLWHPI